jgi:outer membrane biosynthesis protein TonB
MADIKLSCPQCGITLKVRDQLAGKKIKCPKCAAVCPVPAAGEAPKPSPAASAPKPAGQKPPAATRPAGKVTPIPKAAERSKPDKQREKVAAKPTRADDSEAEVSQPARSKKGGVLLGWFVALIVLGYLGATGFVYYQIVTRKPLEAKVARGMS